MKEQEIKGKMFQEIENIAEREAALEANCVRQEVFPVKKIFTEEEVNEMRRNYTQNAVEMNKQLEELERKKTEIKAKYKPLLEENKYLLSNIRTGFQEHDQQVYLFDFQEDGQMGYYDGNGELVYSRKLMPNEKQLNVISMAQRTGTEG